MAGQSAALRLVMAEMIKRRSQVMQIARVKKRAQEMEAAAQAPPPDPVIKRGPGRPPKT